MDRSPGSNPATVRGDLLQYPLPRLLFHLLRKVFTGVLELGPTPEGGQARIYFRDGLPCRADLPSMEDVLGRVLVERGVINHQQYNDSLQQLSMGGQLHGQILLAMGALDEAQLVDGLRLQLRRKLNRLFYYGPATAFAIIADNHPHGLQGEATRVRVDPLFVIYHGVRNAFGPAQLAPELEKLSGMLLQLHPQFASIAPRFAFGQEEQALLSVLQAGQVPFERVFRISNLSPTETQMLVYTLRVTETLVSQSNPEAPKAPAPAVASPAIAPAPSTPGGARGPIAPTPSSPGIAAPMAPTPSSPGIAAPMAPTPSSPGIAAPIAPTPSSPGIAAPPVSAATAPTPPTTTSGPIAAVPSQPIFIPPPPEAAAAFEAPDAGFEDDDLASGVDFYPDEHTRDENGNDIILGHEGAAEQEFERQGTMDGLPSIGALAEQFDAAPAPAPSPPRRQERPEQGPLTIELDDDEPDLLSATGPHRRANPAPIDLGEEASPVITPPPAAATPMITPPPAGPMITPPPPSEVTPMITPPPSGPMITSPPPAHLTTPPPPVGTPMVTPPPAGAGPSDPVLTTPPPGPAGMITPPPPAGAGPMITPPPPSGPGPMITPPPPADPDPVLTTPPPGAGAIIAPPPPADYGMPFLPGAPDAPAPTITPPPPSGGAFAPPPPSGGAFAPPPPSGGAIAPPPPSGGAIAPPPPTAGAFAPPPPASGAFIPPAPPAGSPPGRAPSPLDAIVLGDAPPAPGGFPTPQPGAMPTPQPGAMPTPSPAFAPPPASPAAAPAEAVQSPSRRREAEEHKKLIAEKLVETEEADYFTILGIDRNATINAIREAYFTLAKQFHPDKIAGLGVQDVADDAEELFRRINEAHTTLTDDEQRKTYIERLDRGTTDEEEQAKVREALEAEFAFQKGTVFFRKKSYREALVEFKQAFKLAPNEGEHLAWVAWTVFCDPRNKRGPMLAKLKQQLLEAINISPNSPASHYFLGEVYLAMEEEKRATTCFRKALEINPNHVDSARQLRIIQMRRQREDSKQKKSLFTGDLFGRFKKKK